MEIKIETRPYNERRYGRPWIAIASFGPDGKADYQFGDWIGRPGEAGVLRLVANPGDVVARGQKDNRGDKGETEFYVVEDDGSLGAKMTRAEAWEYDRSRDETGPPVGPLAKFTTDELLAELRRRGH